MYTTLLFLFNVTVAYLVGSVCSAVIVCRLFDLPDPRTKGSKNPGTSNVLRLAGKQYASIVLLADMLKCLLPVLLAHVLGAGPIILGFTCFAAVIGHMYPLFFDFKGGKGVATALGALLGLNFILGVMVIATWLLVANFSRHASLASIVSTILAPIYSLFVFGNLSVFLPIMFISLAILYKHGDNITRLMDGTEEKISFRHKAHHKSAASEQQPADELQPAEVTSDVPPPKKKTKTATSKTKAKKISPKKQV